MMTAATNQPDSFQVTPAQQARIDAMLRRLARVTAASQRAADFARRYQERVLQAQELARRAAESKAVDKRIAALRAAGVPLLGIVTALREEFGVVMTVQTVWDRWHRYGRGRDSKQ